MISLETTVSGPQIAAKLLQDPEETAYCLAELSTYWHDGFADEVAEHISNHRAVSCRLRELAAAIDAAHGQPTSAFTPHPISDGVFTINGKPHMKNARGGYEPRELIPARDLLQDETVRKIMGYAIALSEQIARFKEHTFADIGAFEAILAQEYQTSVGGKKGNMTLMTVDGLFKVSVQVADRITFGPELQAAKALFDECLTEWSAEARAEVRGLIADAFNTDKEGTVNRALIFVLLRRESDDPRWKRGQDAIRDAIRVVGSKTYVRAHRRDDWDALWRAIPLDIAKL